MSEKEMIQRNIQDLREITKKDATIYQESNLYTLSIDGVSIVTTKGPMVMNKIIESIIQVYKVNHDCNQKTTIPIRASTIPNIPNQLRGMDVCQHCIEPLYNHRNKKYFKYCPECGRIVKKE